MSIGNLLVDHGGSLLRTMGTHLAQFSKGVHNYAGLARIGARLTPVGQLTASVGIASVGTLVGIYGTTKFFKSTSTKDKLKFGLLAGVGFGLAAFETYSRITELFETGFKTCDSKSLKFDGRNNYYAENAYTECHTYCSVTRLSDARQTLHC